jgi:tol-pal system protein YbgF
MRCCALALAVVLAMPGLVSCGGARDATEKELSELRSELTKLRSEQARAQERLDALEIASGGLRSGGAAAGDVASPGKPIDPDRPDLEVVRLAPDADPDDPDADTPRPVVRAVGSGGSIVDRGAKGKITGGAQDDLDKALDLYKAKSWDKALEMLAAFLVKNPDHPSADVATFYRGECYLAKGEARRALEQFEAVSANYPQSSRAPDAMLRAAQAYVKLGDKASADQTKKKLLSTYPGSDAAKKLASSEKKTGSEKKKP